MEHGDPKGMPSGKDSLRTSGHAKPQVCLVLLDHEQARCYQVLASSSAEQKGSQIPLPDFQEAQLSFLKQPRAVVPSEQSPFQGEHGVQAIPSTDPCS